MYIIGHLIGKGALATVTTAIHQKFITDQLILFACKLIDKYCNIEIKISEYCKSVLSVFSKVLTRSQHIYIFFI